ncbi:twin-arginine translocation signal domain-containing protein [Spirosoma sp. HMF3257]|uniref:Bifunctional metallophosphatase/5'-nucleotidase n=1 Tax=Spirosoma telluris TaxID=2183553 RepID=A0A327NPZ6_9BACT|nr:twin-arginine translocation signal domain-containing protein [Spirosoma telluris]RAI77440.1 bifunctional metallophosphatase/5'-nucleotidase [Spirosoma telluris]
MDALASNRRQFLKLLGTAAVVGSIAPDVLAHSDRASSGRAKTSSLTILHTNDVHSRLDPFPMDGSRNAGKGGVARRATLIKKIRQEQANVLLFDAGDIFQGTPYFNLYKGEPEILAMNQLGYDAGTIGNHDFDGGIDNMVTQFGKASFPLLIANYDFKNTVMDGKTMPYKIFEKDGIRVGVFGLGIQPAGLIPKEAYKETKYLDPIELGSDTAAQLRHDRKCDYVICLSHLGFKYNNEPTVSDNILAAKTRNIDLIIGGHTHTFLDAPVAVNNLDGQPVWINQVGFAGINLGRIDLAFERGKAVSSAGKSVEVK